MMEIFDRLEGQFVYTAALIDRARKERERLRAKGLILALEDRPTLRMRPQDHVTALRHLHEGAWTIGMFDEDLPGFEP